MSNTKEIENQKETENLEAVIERHAKLETDRINKIKELKKLETTKKELEIIRLELEIEKISETIAFIPK